MSNQQSPLIYIVDGNSSYRKILLNCLHALNICKVKFFSSGEDCLNSDSPDADIIMLDYNLGIDNMNGLEFMREYNKTRNSTFLFMSSNTKVDIAVEAIRSGAYDYIVKSRIGLERMVAKLQNIMEAKKLQRRSLVFQRAAVLALFVSTAAIVLASIIYSA